MTVTDIKAAVRQRDGNRCTKCGMTNDAHLKEYGASLHVHRVHPRSLYNVEGCITVCWRCHGPLPKAPPGTPNPYRRGSSLFVYIDADLAATLSRLAAESEPHTSQKAIVELALRRYFASVGEWPPVPPPSTP